MTIVGLVPKTVMTMTPGTLIQSRPEHSDYRNTVTKDHDRIFIIFSVTSADDNDNDDDDRRI